MSSRHAKTSISPTFPAVPAVCVNTHRAIILSPEGEIYDVPLQDARRLLKGKQALLCHAPFTRARLGMDDSELQAWDVLELFAFVHPAKFCVPTPHGLARAAELDPPESFEDWPFALMQTAQAILRDLPHAGNPENLIAIAGLMGLNGRGWPWSPWIFAALGRSYDPSAQLDPRSVLDVWKNLPEWAEEAPLPPPAHHPVTPEEAHARLLQILGTHAEQRDPQITYARRMTHAFAPGASRTQDPDQDTAPEHEPHVLLAEAGTGVGKTLGYLAPAGIWAEKNQGSVWISTYTRALQRQIARELERLYPNPEIRAAKTAIRKGRENYLCLLNFEDIAASAALAQDPRQAVSAGLMARWIARTQEGDLSGADFPGWLTGILGHAGTHGLADRRGECVYAACDHYHRCFVERSIRKARRADIVVANHALVMTRTAGAGAESDLPRRYVFDEGHHLFDAADHAFAFQLTAVETREMRRWILGAEDHGRKTRARGLRRRLQDLVTGNALCEAALVSVQGAAHALTADGWVRRLKSHTPDGPAEHFLCLVSDQVQARTRGVHNAYTLETPVHPPLAGLQESAQDFLKALRAITRPLRLLVSRFRMNLEEDQGDMSAESRKRIDSVCRSLTLRILTLEGWIGMLETIQSESDAVDFVDWMEITRIDGAPVDLGVYRHWIDPMRPFADALRPHAHGVAITSATLRDLPDAPPEEESPESTGQDSPQEDWDGARTRTGAAYLTRTPQTFTAHSPFAYGEKTRVLILNDVNRDDTGQVAGAYRALFEAAGGGALGLFTAVSRLRAVHARISEHLEACGLSLYAQHVDKMDAGTLVDIFREETNACLLGTDAVRDGVDVPGESLRLLVYDRVPWPRPSLLHKARREAFGGRAHDDQITRFKLRQAYGRLIRRVDDRGVFVLVGGESFPSRLLGAFPEGVIAERCGIAHAVDTVRTFLKP